MRSVSAGAHVRFRKLRTLCRRGKGYRARVVLTDPSISTAIPSTRKIPIDVRGINDGQVRRLVRNEQVVHSKKKQRRYAVAQCSYEMLSENRVTEL